jgi:hypothetical protein
MSAGGDSTAYSEANKAKRRRKRHNAVNEQHDETANVCMDASGLPQVSLVHKWQLLQLCKIIVNISRRSNPHLSLSFDSVDGARLQIVTSRRHIFSEVLTSSNTLSSMAEPGLDAANSSRVFLFLQL